MKRAKKINYQEAILATVAVTGMIIVAMVAPNCLQLLHIKSKSKTKNKYYINQTILKLKDKGLIKIGSNSRGQKVVRLTEAGKDILKEHQLRQLKINQPTHWDRKYRLIIFDIKEWKRIKRDKLRGWLEHLGLVRLQNSVWVYPYDCREIITLLKANYHIGKEVLYLEVSYLENDSWLKKKFNLE